MHKVPYLVKYSVKRLLLALVTAFIILTITFVLIKLLPDPAYPTSTEGALAFCRDQANKGYYYQFYEAQEGLGDIIIQPFKVGGDASTTYLYFYKKPIIAQYGAWLSGIFTKWDWGTSSAVIPNADAMSIIGTRLVPSIVINIVSLIFSLPLGFLFGIIAALNKNKPTDHIISTIVMIFISVPSFIIISILLLLLGYMTNWLPTSWPASGAPIGEYCKALVIPVLSLSFGTIAGFTRYTRAELCEVMSSEFLLLARTKGLT